jgi:hypothetical protein
MEPAELISILINDREHPAQLTRLAKLAPRLHVILHVASAALCSSR